MGWMVVTTPYTIPGTDEYMERVWTTILGRGIATFSALGDGR